MAPKVIKLWPLHWKDNQQRNWKVKAWCRTWCCTSCPDVLRKLKKTTTFGRNESKLKHWTKSSWLAVKLYEQAAAQQARAMVERYDATGGCACMDAADGELGKSKQSRLFSGNLLKKKGSEILGFLLTELNSALLAFKLVRRNPELQPSLCSSVWRMLRMKVLLYHLS